jgi:hypothetical protein
MRGWPEIRTARPQIHVRDRTQHISLLEAFVTLCRSSRMAVPQVRDDAVSAPEEPVISRYRAATSP